MLDYLTIYNNFKKLCMIDQVLTPTLNSVTYERVCFSVKAAPSSYVSYSYSQA